MNEIVELYESIPLPYKYCRIPSAEEPDLIRKTKRFYWVNQVIPNVAKLAFKHAGFHPTSKKTLFNASWGKQYESSDFESCKCWQKVNHFSGAYLIGRKDQLHKRMTELSKRTDTNYTSFYPKSYLLPEDYNQLQMQWKKKILWIVKPVASSRGRGIRVVSSKESKPPQKSGLIVQYYISRPFLITGRKFDIRLYALVTSVSPIRIYLHKSGLARFATHEYDTKTPTDRHTHLTNFSVNKSDSLFIKSIDQSEEKVENSKWSLSFFLNYLDQIGIESQKIMEEIEKVVCMTVIAGMSEVRSFHNRHVIHRHTSYELYGLDVILDENLRPHIMEVNISPSLNSTDSSLDFGLKYPLVIDVLKMARIIDCNPKSDNPCPGMVLVDKECRQSLSHGRITEIECLFKTCSQSNLSSSNSPRRMKSKATSSMKSFQKEKIETSHSSLHSNLSSLSVLPVQQMKKTDVECEIENDNENVSNFEWSKLNNISGNKSPWKSPVFADFVMIRDFLEEKQRLGGFHRIYPKRKNMDNYTACFSSMRYHDIVFGSWIRMSNDQRLNVIQKNWKVYTDAMNRIQAMLPVKK